MSQIGKPLPAIKAKRGKSVQNAVLTVHELFSREIIPLALARFGLS